MRTVKILIFCLTMIPLSMFSQTSGNTEYFPLIGEQAPKFDAKSTAGDFTFPNDFNKSWKILFSHPQDFTPVCTSEILELAMKQKDFEKLGVKFAILSTDNLERHQQWVKSMEGLTYKGRKDNLIDFPLIADPKFVASKKYGMIHKAVNTTKNVRGVFIIDPENVIRSILYYPMEVGRNIDEIERTVLALQKADNEQVFTPANWSPGEDLIVPFASKDKDATNTYSVSWYLTLRKDIAQNLE